MSGLGPGGSAARFGPLRRASLLRRNARVLAAASAPLAAASWLSSPPNPSHHHRQQQQPHQQHQLAPRCSALASTSASASTSAPSLIELLGPSLAQAAAEWLTKAAAAAQRYVESQLAELHSGGCPATSAVLKAHLYGAAVQLGTLGLATRFLVLDPAAVARGQVWRLLTWSLVHAGPLHLLANYTALAKLGPQLEKVAGADRFTAVYCGSAAAATVFSLALNGGRASLGSSGAVFGVAAALWRYHAAHSELLPQEATAALRASGERTLQATAVYHLLLWSRLDASAHLGGALGGWALAELLGPDYRLERAAGGGLLGWPLALFGGGAGGGGGAGVQFRDRPRVKVYAEQKSRFSIPFPALGPGYSVPAAGLGLPPQR